MAFFAAVRVRVLVGGLAVLLVVLAAGGWGARQVLGRRAAPAVAPPPGLASRHTVGVGPGAGGADPGGGGAGGTLGKGVGLGGAPGRGRDLTQDGVRTP
nr:hypothetical protein [Bacillota bacterium]